MIGGQITEETIGDHLGGEEGRRTLEIIIEEEEGEDISGEVCYISSC
jgi:predicted DNA-binding protein with PD1-like motif